MKKTFYVILDGNGESYAAFPDLLPALRHLDELMGEGENKVDAEYLKVEAVWAEDPKDAALHGKDGYLTVFDSEIMTPAWFPDVDPAKKTFFVVEDWATELDDDRLGTFTELLEALELWHFWADRTEDLDTIKIWAFYVESPAGIKTGDDYLEVWNVERYLDQKGLLPVFEEYIEPKNRTFSRVKRGGFPKAKDWSPTGITPPTSLE